MGSSERLDEERQTTRTPSKLGKMWPKLHTMFVMSQYASQRLASLTETALPSIGLILSMRPDVIVHQPAPPELLTLTLHDLPAACDPKTLVKSLGVKKGAQVTKEMLNQKNMKTKAAIRRRAKVLPDLLETETGKAIQILLSPASGDELLLAMQRDHPRQATGKVFLALSDFQTWVGGIGYSEEEEKSWREIHTRIEIKDESPFLGPVERNKVFEDQINGENQILRSLMPPTRKRRGEPRSSSKRSEKPKKQRRSSTDT